MQLQVLRQEVLWWAAAFSRHHKQQWVLESPGKPAPSAGNKPKGGGKGGKSFLQGNQTKKRVAVLGDGSLWEYDSGEVEHYADEEEPADDISEQAVLMQSAPEATAVQSFTAQSTVQDTAVGAASVPAPAGSTGALSAVPPCTKDRSALARRTVELWRIRVWGDVWSRKP